MVNVENQFGRTSKLRWRAVEKDGKTILQDVYFTAPYKIMSPFQHKDGSVSVMQLTASAGVMAGDVAEYDFTVESGARIEFLSQSFEKIHKMDEGKAVRKTNISVAAGAQFFYHPLPVIPFADSSFENETQVELADDTAQFEYYEIVACGRSARGERFVYDTFLSRIHIRRAGKLIFCDNTMFFPKQFPLEQIGFYEGFTHMGNLIFCSRGKDEIWAGKVRELLKQEPDVEGGVTRLESRDYLVKIFGKQAQKLQDLAAHISIIN